MKIHKVYLITNTINGKQYVGITSSNITARWNRHVYSATHELKACHRRALHRAIRKYGKDKFSKILLYESESHEHICQMETHFINLYETHGSKGGYNMTYGGEGWFGMRHTEESKRKMSIAHTGKKLSDEHRKKIGDRFRGGHFIAKNPEQWKKNLSESKRKNPIIHYEYEIIDPNGVTTITTNIHRYCEGTDLNSQNLSKVIKNGGTYMGYTGRILKDYGINKGNRQGRKNTVETKKKMKDSAIKYMYTIYHPCGKITVTKYLKDFCVKYNIQTSNMGIAVNKNEKQNITDISKLNGSKGYKITRELI